MYYLIDTSSYANTNFLKLSGDGMTQNVKFNPLESMQLEYFFT